jgi:hypothetical protein
MLVGMRVVRDSYAYLQQRVEASCLLPLLQLLGPGLDLVWIRRRGGAQDVVQYALGEGVRLSRHLYGAELGIHGWRVVWNGRRGWGIYLLSQTCET